ncbi:hypothetical protein Taro_003257 [Colocasia esculenta]|uniref:Uncharacterized protein n=1 Tax=Colocasia esculenta TaxID=4460 RepID=A0A843TRB4_COLES|nr:hypothetical protein [Colocasia esculenta]
MQLQNPLARVALTHPLLALMAQNLPQSFQILLQLPMARQWLPLLQQEAQTVVGDVELSQECKPFLLLGGEEHSSIAPDGAGSSRNSHGFEREKYNSLKASSKLSESDLLHEEKDESDVTFSSRLAMNARLASSSSPPLELDSLSESLLLSQAAAMAFFFMRCNLLDSSASSSSLLFKLSWLYEPSFDVSSSALRALGRVLELVGVVRRSSWWLRSCGTTTRSSSSSPVRLLQPAQTVHLKLAKGADPVNATDR